MLNSFCQVKGQRNFGGHYRLNLLTYVSKFIHKSFSMLSENHIISHFATKGPPSHREPSHNAFKTSFGLPQHVCFDFVGRLWNTFLSPIRHLGLVHVFCGFSLWDVIIFWGRSFAMAEIHNCVSFWVCGGDQIFGQSCREKEKWWNPCVPCGPGRLCDRMIIFLKDIWHKMSEQIISTKQIQQICGPNYILVSKFISPHHLLASSRNL